MRTAIGAWRCTSSAYASRSPDRTRATRVASSVIVAAPSCRPAPVLHRRALSRSLSETASPGSWLPRAAARYRSRPQDRRPDAHSVAVAAVRAKELRVLAPDGQLEALRMLVDHRDQLSSRRVQTVNRLHRLLAELVPGKAKKDLTALQAGDPG
ncbi:MAG TPA: transposase [Jiangellales bacterium]|nr:transposase [Jiangellales bacterium]